MPVLEHQILFNRDGGIVFKRLNRYKEFHYTHNITSNTNAGSIILYNHYNNFYNSDGTPLIEVGEFIYIFARDELSGTSDFGWDELRFVGVVRQIRQSPFTREVKVDFADLTYDILQSVFPYAESGTPPELIEKLLQYVSQDGGGRYGIIPHPTLYETLRPDGSSFPTVKYAGKKKVVEIINEILQPTATNTYEELLSYDHPAPKSYYWGLQASYDQERTPPLQYYFTLQYPEEDLITTIDLRKDNHIDYTIDTNQTDIIGYVIYTAGTDLNGNTIHNMLLDKNNRKGGKSLFKPFTEQAEKVFNEEVKAGNIVEDVAGTIYRDSKRYDTASYPIITSWNVSVADRTEYNREFKNHVIKETDKIAWAYIDTKAKGEIGLNLKGTFGVVVGSFMKLITPSGKSFNYRIMEIKQQFNATDGWITQLKLQEDRETSGIIQVDAE